MSQMKRERLELTGRLADAQRLERRLRLAIKGGIEAARSKLNPYEDMAEIEIDSAREQLFEARAKQEELEKLLVRIKFYKRDLGEV